MSIQVSKGVAIELEDAEADDTDVRGSGEKFSFYSKSKGKTLKCERQNYNDI